MLERFGESFNVDVGGPFVATLSALAFEGALVRLATPPHRQPSYTVSTQGRFGVAILQSSCAGRFRRHGG